MTGPIRASVGVPREQRTEYLLSIPPQDAVIIPPKRSQGRTLALSIPPPPTGHHDLEEWCRTYRPQMRGPESIFALLAARTLTQRFENRQLAMTITAKAVAMAAVRDSSILLQLYRKKRKQLPALATLRAVVRLRGVIGLHFRGSVPGRRHKIFTI